MLLISTQSDRDISEGGGGDGGGHGCGCGGGGGRSQTDRQVGGRCLAPPEDPLPGKTLIPSCRLAAYHFFLNHQIKVRTFLIF